jgi:hypothetical protein
MTDYTYHTPDTDPDANAYTQDPDLDLDLGSDDRDNGGGADTTAEDAAMVDWVDQRLADADSGGFLDGLARVLEAGDDREIDPNEVAELIDRARDEPAGDDVEPPRELTDREKIREQIFAKLRRPDGTPFAAGYTSGPAARKAMYEAEDTRTGQWRSRPYADTTLVTTIYDDRETLEERVSESDAIGRVLDATGQPVDGKWGWVIDQQTGALLLFDPSAAVAIAADETETRINPKDAWGWIRQGYTIRTVHHTTPIAGMPVTGAGMITLRHGVITELTDESGHYRPTADQQYAAVQALTDQHYNLEEAKIRLTGSDAGGRPTDKTGWLTEAGDTNEYFPTGDVSLGVTQFEQSRGDEYQIRMKSALGEELKAKVPKVPATTKSYGKPTAGQAAAADVEDEDDTFVDDDGIRKRIVPDPNRPNYTIKVPVEDLPTNAPYNNDDLEVRSESSAYEDDHERRPASAYPDDLGGALRSDSAYSTEGLDLRPESLEADDDLDRRSASAYPDDLRDDLRSEFDGADNASDPAQDTFLEQARQYLLDAGRDAFSTWFGTLSRDQQDSLLVDPQIAAAWQAEPAGAPPPAAALKEEDHVAAARTNAGVVDGLKDRQSAGFSLAGFMLLIGDDHEDVHRAYVDTGADRVTGTVTVRKGAVGRGAGSLTFTAVPPAKQDIVLSAVKRFSKKEVRFG